MLANYVVNADFEAYAAPWTTDNPDQLNDLLERAEHYVDLIGAGNPVVMPATDTVHVINSTGNPTGGTFTLSVLGVTTAVLPYNATYSQVSSALNTANGFSGLAYVTGGPLPYLPIYVGYAGSLVGTFVPEGSVAASVTGGTTPAMSFTLSAPGGGFGKRFNPSRLGPGPLQALKNAVCAQAQYMINTPSGIFDGAQYSSVKGPDFTTQGRLNPIAPKARRELASSGMALALTRAR